MDPTLHVQRVRNLRAGAIFMAAGAMFGGGSLPRFREVEDDGRGRHRGRSWSACDARAKRKKVERRHARKKAGRLVRRKQRLLGK